MNQGHFYCEQVHTGYYLTCIGMQHLIGEHDHARSHSSNDVQKDDFIVTVYLPRFLSCQLGINGMDLSLILALFLPILRRRWCVQSMAFHESFNGYAAFNEILPIREIHSCSLHTSHMSVMIFNRYSMYHFPHESINFKYAVVYFPF